MGDQTTAIIFNVDYSQMDFPHILHLSCARHFILSAQLRGIIGYCINSLLDLNHTYRYVNTNTSYTSSNLHVVKCVWIPKVSKRDSSYHNSLHPRRLSYYLQSTTFEELGLRPIKKKKYTFYIKDGQFQSWRATVLQNLAPSLIKYTCL